MTQLNFAPATNSPIYFTDHACTRMAQRNYSEEEIHFIVQHGKKTYRAGVVIIYLRRCDIPESQLCDSTIARLEGSTVIMNQRDKVIITVYHSCRDKGYKAIRKMAIRDFRKRPCPQLHRNCH